MKNTLNIGIIGATGYVGMELVRILCNHPKFKIARLVSQSYVGKYFSEIYPQFRSIVDIKCSDLDIEDIANSCDIVITALPHGVSSEVVPKLLEKGVRVLDHSGDFRYRDVATYEKTYKLVHPAPELSINAAYGLPEIYRDSISTSNLVANPGCYPTCSILGANPLLKYELVDTDSIIIDATSGVSGAGRTKELAFTFCEADENYKAYGVVGHRHTSEIEQELSFTAGENIAVSFTPHLAPLKRGMLATIYAKMKSPMSIEDIHKIYMDEYKNEYFVRVLPIGSLPETKYVCGTNFVDISVFIDSHTNRVVVLSAIDNLGKGASQQAVQALNCMVGIPENTGLMHI